MYISVSHTNGRSIKSTIGVIVNCLVGMGLSRTHTPILGGYKGLQRYRHAKLDCIRLPYIKQHSFQSLPKHTCSIIDPTDSSFNMRYFPRISPNSLKILSKYSNSKLYLSIKTISFLLHVIDFFMAFNLIYWTPTCG